MRTATLILVAATALEAGAWQWDFSSGKIAQWDWWSIAKPAKKSSLAFTTNTAGAVSLAVSWAGEGSWMHVYQAPPREKFPQADRVHVVAEVAVDDSSASKVRRCNLRFQDRDCETFYFRRNVSWNYPGTYTVHFIVDTNNLGMAAKTSLADKKEKHNHTLDYPLSSVGLNFEFGAETGPATVHVKRLEARVLPVADPARFRAEELAHPLVVPAEMPLLVGYFGGAEKSVNPASGKVAVKCTNGGARREFGVDFTRYGSPVGVHAPQVPKYETAELLVDVTMPAASSVDGLRIVGVDTGSGREYIDAKAPALQKPGSHTVRVKLPRDFYGTSYWGRERTQRLFVLGGVHFTSSGKCAPTVAWIDGVRIAYTGLAADSLRLDLETGDPVHFIGRDVKTVTAILHNASTVDTEYRIAAQLFDYRGVPTLWQRNETLRLAGDGVARWPVSVPQKDGVYYVRMQVSAAGSSAWEPTILERTFLRAQATGASPRLRDKDDFCFGSVAHLNPYFGNEAGIKRVADSMSRIGLKVLRTDYRVHSDFDDAWYDKVVDIFTSRGMDIDFILGYRTDAFGVPKWEASRAAYNKGFERYKGRIRFWEMLNEPDIPWGAKYPPTATNYALLAWRTAHDLRAIDPAATFMSAGFCAFDNKQMGPFQKDAMMLCWRAFDLHCFHGHGAYEWYRDHSCANLLKLRREVGITIPWYANETAISCSNDVGERTQADTLYKKVLHSWSLGAKGLTWYNFRGKGKNPDEGEHGFGMMTFDLYPRAVYGAWNGLTALYAGKRFVRELNAGERVRALLFRDARGSVLGLWHDKPVPKRITLKCSGGPIERVDIFGNRETLKADDSGRVTLEISGEPTNIVCPGVIGE